MAAAAVKQGNSTNNVSRRTACAPRTQHQPYRLAHWPCAFRRRLREVAQGVPDGQLPRAVVRYTKKETNGEMTEGGEEARELSGLGGQLRAG